MPAARVPRLYVHIGLPKTGTTYLQNILKASTAELAAQQMVLVPATVVRAIRVSNAIRGKLDAELTQNLLASFDHEVQAAGTADVVFSQEQLAATPADRVTGFLEHLQNTAPEREVRLVVTVRSIARQLPSSWQEQMKTRGQLPYPRFVRAVVERRPRSLATRRSQDLIDVLDRWCAAIPADRVAIVTVPAGDRSGALLRRYCDALGIDPAPLREGDDPGNPSLGLVQAELLRQVNAALGDRLVQPQYATTVRRYLVPDVLRAQRSAPPLLPKWTREWCEQTTQEWITRITDTGYQVYGDLEDLRPQDGSFVDEQQHVPDDDVHAAAIEAIATMIDLHSKEQQAQQTARSGSPATGGSAAGR